MLLKSQERKIENRIKQLYCLDHSNSKRGGNYKLVMLQDLRVYTLRGGRGEEKREINLTLYIDT